MSQNESTEDGLGESCSMVEGTNEFVDEVDAIEISKKLFEQIEQLQV